MKVYFREKIQMLYSNKTINEILETQTKANSDKAHPKAPPAPKPEPKAAPAPVPSEPTPIVTVTPVLNDNDEQEPRQSIATHKELRMKKYDLETKMKVDNENDRNFMIKNLMDQHQSMNNLIKSHYQKELFSQEDEFNRRMNERRERSLERSLVRGGSKRDMPKNPDSASKANTGLNAALGPGGIKYADKLVPLVPLVNGKKPN